MGRTIPFFCSLLCAATFLGSSGNLTAEPQVEGTDSARGLDAQNKAPSVIGCPVERYPVRFGRDDDANLVDLSVFSRTSAEAMRSWSAPGVLPYANRISPYETTVLALQARLIAYWQERSLDDSDYTLVLADESGRTILAKISSPNCAAQDDGEPGSQLPESRFVVGITSSRGTFAARLSPTTAVKRVNIPVVILGIGMFDLPSGQTGEAPNGIQLCPVLDIAFDEAREPVIHIPVEHHPR